MGMSEKSIIIVIPSYEPPLSFVSYTEQLLNEGATAVIVVNDGSSEKYMSVYDKISKINGVTLLSYAENRGKGYALKFAFNYISDNYDSNFVIVTADCDGQHLPSDVLSVANKSIENPLSFILGVRDFSNELVPKRSKFGNLSTRKLFNLLYGIKITDTQTGLRAFSSELLPFMQKISGNRFEYEMNAIIVSHKNGVPIIETPIETIYEEKPVDVDKRSHFKTFSDSFKVWSVLFRNLNAYALAVILSVIIEICTFTICEYAIFNNRTPQIRTLFSTVTARILSSAFNYAVNYKFVFNGSGKSTVIKYYVLWTILLTLSYLFTNFFGNVLGLPVVLFKVITDLGLSILSFRAQTTWVFKNEQEKTPQYEMHPKS